MNQRKIISGLFFISSLVIIGSVVIALLSKCSLPDGSTYYCSTNFQEQKIWPVFLSFIPLFVIFPILFFVRREIFLAWAKFAGVAFPLMLAALLYTFNNEPAPSGFGLGGLIPDELFASVVLPPLFLIISLAIIALKLSEFSVGLNAHVRLVLKYSGLAMIIFPTLFLLLIFIWWFGVGVLGM